MSPWNQGRAVIDQLLADGRVERVPVNHDGAAALVAAARTHLRSAHLLADTDVALAYDALHAANRKALTALLLTQGLRPTRDAGHTGVLEAARAQLDPPLGSVFAPYTRVRRMRNAGDYLDESPARPDDVREDHPLCEKIVDTAAQAMEHLPPY